MENLVILDYTDASVHIYKVEPDTIIDDSYIENLGFTSNGCYWMFGEDTSIVFHREILK